MEQSPIAQKITLDYIDYSEREFVLIRKGNVPTWQDTTFYSRLGVYNEGDLVRVGIQFFYTWAEIMPITHPHVYVSFGMEDTSAFNTYDAINFVRVVWNVNSPNDYDEYILAETSSAVKVTDPSVFDTTQCRVEFHLNSGEVISLTPFERNYT